MKMRPARLICALALGGGTIVFAAGDDFASPLLATFEAGIVCAQDSGVTRDAPDTVAGSSNVIDEAPAFVSTGRVAPAVLGLGFGVQAGVSGDIGMEGVTMSVTHPPFDGSGATRQSFTTYIGPGDDPSITMYQFDFPYELALGDWTMRASRSGVTFYEVTFTVMPPAALPDLAGVCGYTDLLS